MFSPDVYPPTLRVFGPPAGLVVPCSDGSGEAELLFFSPVACRLPLKQSVCAVFGKQPAKQHMLAHAVEARSKKGISGPGRIM